MPLAIAAQDRLMRFGERSLRFGLGLLLETLLDELLLDLDRGWSIFIRTDRG